MIAVLRSMTWFSVSNLHELTELAPSWPRGEMTNGSAGFAVRGDRRKKLNQQLLSGTTGNSKRAIMSIGFDQPLYILPFDQRESFQTKMFGWEGALSTVQTAEIADAKQVIYDGFQAGVAGGAPKEHAAILVDEQFGAAILHDAAVKGYMTACPAEKSGQKEFDFEYGEEFARHIE